MLTIGDFSGVCHLPAQTLRFYHSEGLLVPAEVDERTGYRSYAFDQVRTAVLVTALRGAGMSIAAVRRALADPDTAPVLLAEHAEALARRRRRQDEALGDARALVHAAPRVTEQRRAAITVLSTAVVDPADPQPADPPPHEEEQLETATAAAADALARVAAARGLDVTGPAWWAPAPTDRRERDDATGAGPQWVVELPVTGDGAAPDAAGGSGDLPAGVRLRHLEAGQELSVLLPGRPSIAKHAAALSHLVDHPLVGAHVDLGQLRHVLHLGGTQTTVAVVRVDHG